MDFARQVELAGFPAGVVVTLRDSPEGHIFRVVPTVPTANGQPGRGLELLLTDEAVRMYGEGPTVALALARLKTAAETGLPAVGADGTYQRAVFVGD